MQPFSAEWLMVFYIANQVLSALIQSLPQPTTSSSAGYIFVYKFMSLLIADFRSFSQKSLPPSVTTTIGETTEIVTTVPTSSITK